MLRAPEPLVSICQADYWLPQGGKRALRIADEVFQSAKQITGFPKPVLRPAGAGDEVGLVVSICQADYWLPQVKVNILPAQAANLFQSAKQITGFPKLDAQIAAIVQAHTRFQSAKQITGFPKCGWLEAISPHWVGFNLPSRLLASPRTELGLRKQDKYMFQSAKQITGFPKVADILGHSSPELFQSAKQITGFPKFKRCSAGGIPRRFQSAKQITGFPKATLGGLQGGASYRFNLPSRLLASPRTLHELAWLASFIVSICQADYWLPQASVFNSAGG